MSDNKFPSTGRWLKPIAAMRADISAKLVIKAMTDAVFMVDKNTMGRNVGLYWWWLSKHTRMLNTNTTYDH